MNAHERWTYQLPRVAIEENVDSTDSALDEIVSSFPCMNFFLHVQDFEQVPFFFHLVMQFKLYSYHLLCAISFAKYSRLTNNLNVNWVK